MRAQYAGGTCTKHDFIVYSLMFHLGDVGAPDSVAIGVPNSSDTKRNFSDLRLV